MVDRLVLFSYSMDMETTTNKLSKAQRNPTLTRPTTLTKCGIWNMHKPAIITWATETCLLEHLSDEDVKVLTKGQLVQECLWAIDRLVVAEEYKAAAEDGQARTAEELLYGATV